MLEIKLKHCPFCGNEAYNIVSATSQMIYVKVRCHKCMIEISDHANSGLPFERVEEMNAKVIEKWNRRCEQSP